MQWRSFFKSPNVKVSETATDECSEIETLLSLYSDGMASDAESRRVELHMSTCESCRSAHFWMRATYEVLSNRPVALPPPDMSSRIRQAIADADARPLQPARLRFNVRPAYAMAATVLIAAIVVGLSHVSGNRPPVVAVVPHDAARGPSIAAVPLAAPSPAPAVTNKSKVTVSPPSVRPGRVASPLLASNKVPQAPVSQHRERPTHEPIAPHSAMTPKIIMAQATPEVHPASPSRVNSPHVTRDVHVARTLPTSPETSPATQPILTHPSPPPVVTQPVAHAPDQVATNRPPDVSTSAPETPSPVVVTPKPVITLVSTHPAGLNVELREAALRIASMPRSDSQSHSYKVENKQAPTGDTVPFVGQALN